MNILHFLNFLCLCPDQSPQPLSSFTLFLTLSLKHCPNKTTDCNQGKCQQVWEPHCSLPWPFLVNPLLTFAKTLFGWQTVGSWKAFAFSRDDSWLAFWLKVLLKFSFLVTVTLVTLFLRLLAQRHTHRHTHTPSHAHVLSHTSSLDVPCPCEWIFPCWPHVSDQARNNTITPCLPCTMPLCISHVFNPTLSTVSTFQQKHCCTPFRLLH